MLANPANRVPGSAKSRFALLGVVAFGLAIGGCGSSSNDASTANLDKPALTIPEGSVDASAKKSGSTGSTGSTADTSGGSSSDSTDTSGTDTGTGTGTGGADTGAGTDTGTGTGTGGADTGGAAPGN